MKRLYQLIFSFRKSEFEKSVLLLIGYRTTKMVLFHTAFNHRSLKENPSENNERMEFLGDAIISSVVAEYLFKKYPYKGEGFLTEMRSKMVNRQQLNHIAIQMGLKKMTRFNKLDGGLKSSQIFGNTLEALVGAVYLDKGYPKASDWVLKQIVIPHMFVDDLELIDINLKNKLIGWANKNGKILAFELAQEKMEGSRRLFTINAVLDGEVLSFGKAYNKKDASQIAAQVAVEKLGL